MPCTYKFKDSQGNEITLTGQPQMKAFLVDGGMEALGYKPEGGFPWEAKTQDNPEPIANQPNYVKTQPNETNLSGDEDVKATDKPSGVGKIQGMGTEGSEAVRSGRGNPVARAGSEQDAEGDAGVLENGQAENVRANAKAGDSGQTGLRAGMQDVGAESLVSKRGDSSSRQQASSDTGLDIDGLGKKSGNRKPVTAKEKDSVDGGDQTKLGNYHIDDPELLIGGTPKVRFAKNKKSLETYFAIHEENRQPTPEERDAIAGYIGWGSFGQELFQGSWERPVFRDGWKEENEWLRDHLGESAWKSAQSSIINAHYTDPPTVQSIWKMVEKLGFTGGKVLEPSMGIGNFFGLMPKALMERSNLTGIELDQTTGNMAKLLYPDGNVQIKGYQDSKAADGFYDLIIGNWPFASQSPNDRRYNKLNLTLHDYFFVKGLDQLREGGVMIGITSAGTMDKVTKLARIEMNKRAVLVSAFRMPMGAFEKYAGTSVVADIIILQKRGDGVVDNGAEWLDVEPLLDSRGNPAKRQDGSAIRVNQYWGKNPDNVLGNMTVGSGTTQGRDGMIVQRQDGYADVLASLSDRLPEKIVTERKTGKSITYVSNNTKDRQNSIVVGDNGKLFVVQGEHLAPLNELAKYEVKSPVETAKREDQIKRIVELRQFYGKLIDADTSGDPKAETYRKQLNTRYQSFVKAHGNISESYALSLFDKVSDPFYPAIAALEINAGTKDAPRYEPAAILSRPTTRSKKNLENPSVTDAFIIARNENALFIDVNRIAELSKTPVDKVVDQLQKAGALFKTPSGNYEVRDIYLAGNVRKKLREALDAKESGQDMDANIEALKKVIPKDTPYFAIEASMGANWISADQYRQFVADLLGATGSDLKDINPVLMPKGWNLKMEGWLNNKPEAKTIWGVPYHPFSKIVNSAFSGSPITIRGRDEKGNEFVDDQRTKEVNEKVDKIREEFKTWAWKEPERRIALEKAFNETMNAFATPDFDGSFMSMDGMALQRGEGSFSLRNHQVNAIWRGVANGRGLYAHEVGTGKSYTISGIAIESRRYGVAKKPVIFAHNANSATLASDIQSMYPAAKVLYIDNLSPATIKQRMYQIANDDWDAVVVPHSLLNRFALTEATLMDIASRDIMALEEEAILSAQEEGFDISDKLDDEDELRKVRGATTAKQLVKQRNAIIENIKKQADRASREDSIPFEKLGIDMILIDEAHEFKKPPLSTKMRVKGLNTNPSGEGIAMHLLTTYVRNLNGGKGVHVFTGTPITNTLNEIYNQMRYVMGDSMDDAGVYEWDSWFNTFAGVVSDVELTSTGEYEAVTRLSGFYNVAELRRFAGQYMDIVFADEMPEFIPRQASSGKTLLDKSLTESERKELLDGRSENPVGRPYKKVINETAPMTPAQKAILTDLTRLAKQFKNATKKERRELMQKGDPSTPILVETNAAKASFDPRLYDPSLSDNPDYKASRVVNNVMRHYAEHPLATQVIFMEKGYNDTTTRSKSDGQGGKIVTKHQSFNVAKDIIEKLVASGIPKNQIALVTGSTSKEKRKEIADAMNKAKIRVVIGSTQTLGVGVNMQENLRAMHHVDAPWMPGELEQRNGRGHRQGNKWNTVIEYRYLTEGLDGRRWQVLAIKQKFITAFLKADENTRVIEGDAVDLSESEGIDGISESLSAAAGDPRLLMREKLKGDVNKLENKQRTHDHGIEDAKNQANRLEKANQKLKEAIIDGQDDAAHIVGLKGKDFTAKIDGKKYDKRDEANLALQNAVKLKNRGDTIGSINGFTIKRIYGGLGLYRKGSYEASETIASIEANLRNIAKHVEKDMRQLEDNEQSIVRMNQAAKTPFGQAIALEKKRAMLKQISNDIELYPVAAPSWLREGAPIGTDVYINNKPFTVQSHRWGNDNWYVFIEGKDGNIKPIPYTDVMDENNTPVYEQIPFESPNVIASENADVKKPVEVSALKTPKGIAQGDTVTNANGESFLVERVIKPENDLGKEKDWLVEVKLPNGDVDIVAADTLTKGLTDTLYKQTTTTKGSTVAEVMGWLNPRMKKLAAKEKIVIVPSIKNAPHDAVKTAIASGVQGYYNKKDDMIVLIADRISSQAVLRSVLQHEAYHRAESTDPKLKEQLAKLDKQLSVRFQLASEGKASPIENDAYKRVMAAKTPVKNQGEEFRAYLITLYNNNPENFTGSILQWIKDLYHAIRAALIRQGLLPRDITAADLNALAAYGYRDGKVGGNISGFNNGVMKSMKTGGRVYDARFMENDYSGLSDRVMRVMSPNPDYRLPRLKNAVPESIIPAEAKKDTVTIYRGIPSKVKGQVIRPGDWVSLNKTHALEHGTGETGKNKVISISVPATDVVWAGTDMNEFFYAPMDLMARDGEKSYDLLNRVGDDVFNGVDSNILASFARENSRIGMAFKDVLKRTPELTIAAQKVINGEMSASEYDALVEKYKPVEPYTSIPEPATKTEMEDALSANKLPLINEPSKILSNGYPVRLRLDIPAYTRSGTWVVTIHEDNSKQKVIGYESTAIANNVSFIIDQKGALKIAAQERDKYPLATVSGEWENSTPKAAYREADNALTDKNWIQVGMDPERHSYFYDRKNMIPVVGGDRVIQVGSLLMVKNPVYGNKEDFLFSFAGENAERLAPNGKPSNLNPVQYEQVRTPEFIAWFGDWINDPENASQVVDENGEPLVLHHGTDVQFNEFRLGTFGIHFGTKKAATDRMNGDAPVLKEVFLNIRNPIKVSDPGWDYVNDIASDLVYDGVLNRREADNVVSNFDADNEDHGRSDASDELIRILSGKGIDGGYYTNNVEDAGSTSYIAFAPNQIKSATGNSGDFNPENDDIRFSIADPEEIWESTAEIPRTTVSQVIDKLFNTKDKVRIQSRQLGLSALTQNQLVEIGSEILPMLKSFGVEANNYATTEATWHKVADKLAERWVNIVPNSSKFKRFDSAWQQRNKLEQMRIADMMHEMTVTGDDPRKPNYSGTLKSRYNALLPESKALIDDVEKFHQSVMNALTQSLADKIMATEMPSEEKDKLIADIEEKFKPSAEPYFPLMRFGDYWVDYEEGVEFFETKKAQDDFIKKAKKDGVTISGYGKSLKNFNKIDGVDVGFVDDVSGLIDKLDIEQADQLKDGIFQLYLTALPETSMRKRFIHRKKTPGWEQDALRSFSKKSFHDGKQLAKLKHAPAMRQVLKDADEIIRLGNSTKRKEALGQSIKTAKEMLAELENGTRYADFDDKYTDSIDAALVRRFARFNTADDRMDAIERYIGKQEKLLKAANQYNALGEKQESAADVVNALNVSYDNMMQSNVAPITNLINQTVFTYMLGFSPSSALINYFQTPGVAMPFVAGRHGILPTMTALRKASHLYFTNKDTDGNSILPGLTDQGEIQMYEALTNNGTFDRTRSHDLAGLSEEGVSRGSIHRDFMHASTYMFHKAEVANREITALMAYRMEFKKTGNVKQSIEYANDVINKTHLNYAASNRPDLFQGNAARVMLQFKMYSQGMTYLWGKTTYDALTANNPEKKTEARNIVLCLAGTQIAAAGLLGLPIGGILLAAQALASMMDDDDDPIDIENEIRKSLTNVFGADISRIASRGLLNELGADFSSRLSMADLWIREPDRDLEGKDEAYYLLKTIIGPLGGIIENMAVGMKQIDDGNFQRGIETMLPNSLKGAAKSYRMLEEGGATSSTGNMIYETTQWEKVIQAAGMRPSGLSEQQLQNSAIMNRQTAVTDTKSKLLNKAARAKLQDDQEAFAEAWDDIKAFNEKYPTLRITMRDIMSSVKTRRKNQGKSVDGLVVRPKLRFIRDEENFTDDE